MGRAGVLLDRDGTIIVDYGHVGTIERVEFIDDAPEAIASFNEAGIPVAVITNQAGVARGYYTVEDVEKVHQHIAERLADRGAHVDHFLFCPIPSRRHREPLCPAQLRPQAQATASTRRSRLAMRSRFTAVNVVRTCAARPPYPYQQGLRGRRPRLSDARERASWS